MSSLDEERYRDIVARLDAAQKAEASIKQLLADVIEQIRQLRREREYSKRGVWA
jgi:F0F1-type ATP synthase membrane subunit b/b'